MSPRTRLVLLTCLAVCAVATIATVAWGLCATTAPPSAASPAAPQSASPARAAVPTLASAASETAIAAVASSREPDPTSGQQAVAASGKDNGAVRPPKPPKDKGSTEPSVPPVPADPPAPPTPEDPPVVPEPPAPPATPGVVTAVSCTAGDMEDVIAFGAPAEGGPVTGYALYSVTATDAPPVLVATADAGATSFIVPVSRVGARSYRVAASGDGGEGPLSEAVTNALVSITREVPPEGRTLTAANGEMSLTLAAGSYAATTTVTVTEVAGSPRGGLISLAGVYEISPSGPLGAPATLSVAYTTSIEHFQVRQAVLAAAKLMTYDAATGVWAAEAGAITCDDTYLSGTLSHFSYWTAATVQPHGTSSTLYCSDGTICHNLSAYPDSAARIAARSSTVCFNCHGNIAAAGATIESPNVQAEFELAGSRHPVIPGAFTGVVGSGLYCVICHDPHADPAASPGLLRAKDAATGTYVQGGGGTTPGEALCWTCHGVTSNKLVNYYVPGYYLASGGDKKTGYAGNAHLGRAATTSGAGSCTGCHTGHGAEGESLLAASEENACFACHAASPTVPTDPAPDAMTPNKRDERLIDWAANATTVASGNRVNVGDDTDSAAVGDVDDDGDMDIVAEDMTYALVMYQNVNGDGSLWTPITINAAEFGQRWQDVAVGDIDNDGDLDVAATSITWTNTNVFLFRNTDGAGTTWSRSTIYSVDGAALEYVEMADLTNDGHLDIVYTVNANFVDWVENDGTGTNWIYRRVWYDPTLLYTGLSTGDVDNDGWIDVVYATQTTSGTDHRIYVCRNVDGGGWRYFGDYGSVPLANYCTALECGDFTGDGWADLAWGITVKWVGSTPVAGGVFTNNHDLASTWPSTVLAASGYENPIYGIHIPGSALPNVLFMNMQGGPLVQYTWTPTGWEGLGISNAGYSRQPILDMGDLEGDGDLDLVFGGWYPWSGSSWSLLVLKSGGQGGHPIGDPLRVGRHSTDETAADLGGANRHVECGDCHDSHTAKRGVHALGTNVAAPALDGVWGVQVTNGAAGTTPTYTRTEDVTYEYEVCLKCHSAYVPGYTGLDLSMLFNPANPSTHPIEGPGTNFGIKDEAFTLGTPWNPTAGDDPDYSASSPLMTCSDCHSSDVLSDARGPHGSTFKNLVKANIMNTGYYYQGQNELCYGCHDRGSYDMGGPSTRIDHGHFTHDAMWCLTCHDPHASASKPHLLKIGFTHLANGGIMTNLSGIRTDYIACGTECHGNTKSYTADY